MIIALFMPKQGFKYIFFQNPSYSFINNFWTPGINFNSYVFHSIISYQLLECR